MNPSKKVLKTPEGGPSAIGPYSLGVRAGMFIFASGAIGIDPSTGEFVEGGIEAQTRQALVNMAVVLESGDSSMKSVVKTTVFLKDMGEFSKMNQVYAEFFHEDPPARSTVEVAALPKGAAVEIEAIAIQE